MKVYVGTFTIILINFGNNENFWVPPSYSLRSLSLQALSRSVIHHTLGRVSMGTRWKMCVPYCSTGRYVSNSWYSLSGSRRSGTIAPTAARDPWYTRIIDVSSDARFLSTQSGMFLSLPMACVWTIIVIQREGNIITIFLTIFLVFNCLIAVPNSAKCPLLYTNFTWNLSKQNSDCRIF